VQLDRTDCGDSAWIAILIEVATYVLAVAILIHAIRHTNKFNLSDTGRDELDPSDRFNRARWIETLAVGVLFGIVIEVLLVHFNDYRYGEHFLLPGLSVFPGERVPVSIGIGWGILLYAGTWVAQRLKQPTLPRALFAGLLALNVDVSLDPVARMGGLWCHKASPPNFYGVPYDNYTGWLLIVVSYSFWVRFLFQWADRRSAKINQSRAALWVPPVAVVIASAITVTIDHVLNAWIYPHVCPDWLVFLGLLGFALIVVGRGFMRMRHDLRPSAAILAVPIVYHSICWLSAQSSSENVARVHPSLPALAIPLAFIVGLIGFGWGSRGVFGVPVTPAPR